MWASAPRSSTCSTSIGSGGGRIGARPGHLEVGRPDADDDVAGVTGGLRPRGSGSVCTRTGRLRRRRPPAQVHRRRPDEARDEQVGRLVEELVRRVVLLQRPVAQHRDAVAQRHRLDLVVGDVDRGHPEPSCSRADLGPHLRPAAWRRGWTAARPSGTPPARARSPGPWRPAGAGRRTAGRACGRADPRARASPPPRATRARDLGLGRARVFSPNAMFSRTVMCG